MTSRTALPTDIIDWSRTERDNNILHQIVENGATILSIRTDSVASDFYYYALNIPEGKQFFLYDRKWIGGEGAYNVDVIASPGGFTGGTLANKSALNVVSGTPVSTNLYAGVTLTTPGTITVQEQGHCDSGTGQGSAQAAGAVSADGVFKIFPSGNTSFLRVQRLQAENYTANLRLICWEMDA